MSKGKKKVVVPFTAGGIGLIHTQYIQEDIQEDIQEEEYRPSFGDGNNWPSKKKEEKPRGEISVSPFGKCYEGEL